MLSVNNTTNIYSSMIIISIIYQGKNVMMQLFIFMLCNLCSILAEALQLNSVKHNNWVEFGISHNDNLKF